jgi:protein-S-isoprenylcysteine O-methyltransferase Ste14
MSIPWICRLALIALLFVYLIGSRTIVGRREKYHRLLESTLFNLLLVALYNALCYLPMIIPPDPTVIPQPPLLDEVLMKEWYSALGQVLCLGTIGMLLYTVSKRRAIGGQDTKGKLLTKGIYSFSRHPIYLGIILISLGLAMMKVNLDALLVFPLVFLANFIQARLEEKYDMGVRFPEEYAAYRQKTRMFAPFWFWGLMIFIIIVPLALLLIK